jgi:hypothetical protein
VRFWHLADSHGASRPGRAPPEPLEERRKHLSKLLSRKTKAVRDGIQLSEAITRDGAAEASSRNALAHDET